MTLPFMEDDELVFYASGQPMTVSLTALSKIPFLEALMAGRVNTVKNESGNPTIDRDPMLVHAVVSYATSGNPFHLFAKLPPSSSAKEMLAELDFFLVEPPTVRAANDASFKHELKDVKDEYTRTCKGGPIERTHRANRHAARNAAAELAVGLELGKYEDSVITRNHLYNNILFILSHPRTFGPRLRHHIWELASSHLSFTDNQINRLRSWLEEWEDSDHETDGSDRSESTELLSFDSEDS